MTDKLPDGVSLLILAAIHHHRQANVVQIRDTITRVTSTIYPCATLFAYLDTAVQRRQLRRARGPGANVSDTFELTDEGQALVTGFAAGLHQLVPCGPGPCAGEPA